MIFFLNTIYSSIHTNQVYQYIVKIKVKQVKLFRAKNKFINNLTPITSSYLHKIMEKNIICFMPDSEVERSACASHVTVIFCTFSLQVKG